MRQTSVTVVFSKVVKNEKSCSNNQHIFILFTFDTSDFLAPLIIDLLQRSQSKRSQRLINRNVVFPRAMGVVLR